MDVGFSASRPAALKDARMLSDVGLGAQDARIKARDIINNNIIDLFALKLFMLFLKLLQTDIDGVSKYEGFKIQNDLIVILGEEINQNSFDLGSSKEFITALIHLSWNTRNKPQFMYLAIRADRLYLRGEEVAFIIFGFTTLHADLYGSIFKIGRRRCIEHIGGDDFFICRPGHADKRKAHIASDIYTFGSR